MRGTLIRKNKVAKEAVLFRRNQQGLGRNQLSFQSRCYILYSLHSLKMWTFGSIPNAGTASTLSVTDNFLSSQKVSSKPPGTMYSSPNRSFFLLEKHSSAIRFLTKSAQALFSESTNTKNNVYDVIFCICALGRNRTCIASTANLNSIH